MKREIIKIEGNAVHVTGSDIWMTITELAGMFDATVGVVNSAIKAIIKNDVLNDYEVCTYVRLENGNSADVYNMEVVTALAFRLNTCPAAVFRKWLTRKAVAPTRTAAPIIIQYKGGFLN